MEREQRDDDHNKQEQESKEAPATEFDANIEQGKRRAMDMLEQSDQNIAEQMCKLGDATNQVDVDEIEHEILCELGRQEYYKEVAQKQHWVTEELKNRISVVQLNEQIEHERLKVSGEQRRNGLDERIYKKDNNEHTTYDVQSDKSN